MAEQIYAAVAGAASVPRTLWEDAQASQCVGEWEQVEAEVEEPTVAALYHSC